MHIKNKTIQWSAILFILFTVLEACSKEMTLNPSIDDILPQPTLNRLDEQVNALYKDYNCRVEYRYVENLLPRNWYNITPVNEKFVLPMAIFLKEKWVLPLEAGSSREFVMKTFPTQLVLVGSPAYQKDGITEVLGQAEGGTLLRFTRVNNLDLSNNYWMSMQLTTAYHEYAHILHQNFRLPDEYRRVTPDSYTKNGWKTVEHIEALYRGMVSPYATSSVQEDFAELFAFYITQSEQQIKTWIEYKNPEEQPWKQYDPAIIEAMNKGSAIIRVKLDIMKRMLSAQGLDIDLVRQDLQGRIK